MSDRILVRRYTDPLDPPSMARMRIGVGQNSGNLVFASSAQRSVTVDGVDVRTSNLTGLLNSVDTINDEQRHVVLPLANAFRRSFVPHLTRITEALERLTVPVTILGVGGQFKLDGSPSSSPEVDEIAKRFLRAVLQRGPSIGVRGERTAEYLAALGFTDVDVIGCPSMFLRGPDLAIRSQAPTFDRATRISLNLTPKVPIPDGWIDDLMDRHPRTEFVAQEIVDLDAMLGGRPVKARSSQYPASARHRIIAQNNAVFHQHAPTWIDSMAKRDFTVGHRIHGNIASLLAGTPAHVIVHDSRTAELCEYFEIPHTPVTEHTADLTAEKLFERSDYTALIAGHPARLDRFKGFLVRHGLKHALDLPAGRAPYDLAVAEVPRRPGLVIRPRSTEPEVLDQRLWNTTQLLHENLAAPAEQPTQPSSTPTRDEGPKSRGVFGRRRR